MYKLKVSPAFGYETRWCNAGDFYIDFVLNCLPQKRYTARRCMVFCNLMKFLSYFPGLCLIVGIARIAAALWISKKILPNKMPQILRGILELTQGFIILLIGADIVTTLMRKRICQNKHYK